MKRIIYSMHALILGIPQLCLGMAVIPAPAQKYHTPLTQEDCIAINNDVQKTWPRFVEKIKHIEETKQKKQKPEPEIPFEPLFVQAIKEQPKTLSQEALALRKSIEESWPKVDAKEVELDINKYLIPALEKIHAFKTEDVDDVVKLKQLVTTEISLRNNTLTMQEKEKKIKQGLLVATTSAGIFALQHQHVLEPVIRAIQPTRNPLALIELGSAILDSSKKTLATIAGGIIFYIGCNKIHTTIKNLIYGPQEREFIQKINELKTDYEKEIAALKKKIEERQKETTTEIQKIAKHASENAKETTAETLRITEQARAYAFDVQAKQDKFEHTTGARIKECEIAQKRTESHIVGLERDTAKLRKQLYEEIDKVKKDREKANQDKFKSISDKLELVQDKIKGLTKNGVAINNNEALAILSNELQRLGEIVREIAPNHSRHSSLAPSEYSMTSHTTSRPDSRPVSPTLSVRSTRSEIAPKPRQFSAHVEKLNLDVLKSIPEDHSTGKHSSPTNSEAGSIRIMLPSPNDSNNSNTNQKPPTPRRRRSICPALIGKKASKDVDQDISINSES